MPDGINKAGEKKILLERSDFVRAKILLFLMGDQAFNKPKPLEEIYKE